MIADVLNAYATDVLPHKKTGKKLGYKVSNLVDWWGAKRVTQISAKSCREYAKTKSEQAAAGDIKVLRAAVKYWHAEYGPLTYLPTFWQPAANPPRERYLTKPEAARFLFHARRTLHLRRMILLGLYTGSRPGVILRLRWDQIDFRNGIMSRVPEGAKQDDKKRAPKVKLGKRILVHLRRWKRLDGPSAVFVCHYWGRTVADPWQTWNRARDAAGLDGITPHILRHTRATWMMQAGVPIWEAAGFLGMSVRTLEQVYGHHVTDHQDRAANI